MTKLVDGEYWIPVKGYQGAYEISTAGNVKSCDRLNLNSKGVRRILRGKLLACAIDGEGYPSVSLFCNGKENKVRVHRLVALAFVKNAANKQLVDHIDRNRTNCCVRNLRWVNYLENRANSKPPRKRRLAEEEATK